MYAAVGYNTFRVENLAVMRWWPTYIWPILFVLVGALLAAVGNALTKEGLPRYMILIGSGLAAVGGMWFAVNQISYNIGGDSFVYLDPYFTGSGSHDLGIVEVRLRQAGVHPVYDIHIRIVDFDRRDKDGAPYEQYRNWSRLDPNHVFFNFATWHLPNDADQQSYNIFLSARNGGIFQQIRFRRINGQWRIAMRVIRENKVLIEDGREYLPRDEKGQAIWENGKGRWAR
jgi:hypothetical protein